MYIQYQQNQTSLDPLDTTNNRLNATGGTYRPTYLIRTSDWEKVPGSQAKDGYCTFSYCWEQSGEIVKKSNDNDNNNNNGDEYDCIDNGLHTIVYQNTMMADNEEEQHMTDQVHITYEKFLQQLCKDFQVDYLWYDKVCIDQSNKQAKLHEIKQMHRIYGNARYTMAFVPELKIYDPKKLETPHPDLGTVAREQAMYVLLFHSHWFKRSWTLEEVMSSKAILIIGEDAHFWQHSLLTNNTISTITDLFSTILLDFANQGDVSDQKKGGSVNQALFEAHFRTSSKQHDKIFALANIFPNMFNDIEIDYQINIETTVNNFYKHAATHDLSILCFGSNLDRNGAIQRTSTMIPPQHDDVHKSKNDTFSYYKLLPSWTGVFGRHLPNRVNTNTLFQVPQFVDDQMQLHIITSCYWQIYPKRYEYGCFSPMDPKLKIQYDGQVADKLSIKQNGKRLPNMLKLEEESEESILMTWDLNLDLWSGLGLTHYAHLNRQDQKQKGDSLTRLRVMSLTEDVTDDEEYYILPILLQSHQGIGKKVNNETPALRHLLGHVLVYFLPVFKKCLAKNRYKAIGICLIGCMSDFRKIETMLHWNHCVGREDIDTNDPNTILHVLFENDRRFETNEFIIE